MRTYDQAPAGWWQDSHNRAQPPGSYRDPSLRVSDTPKEARRRPAIARRRHHLTAALSNLQRPRRAARRAAALLDSG